MSEVIYSYTAEQAMEDGVLFDVSGVAKEAGFSWPVRITVGVHELCTPPESNKMQTYEGRLWDVLWMAYCAIKKTPAEDGMTVFTVKIGRRLEKLWAMVDATSGLALHIMKPSEY